MSTVSAKAQPTKPAYEPKRWEEVACPFCGSEDRRPYERYGYRLRFTHVLCRRCGLVYQSPRPAYDEDFVRTAYSDYFAFSEDYEPGDPLGSSTQEEWEQEVREILTFDPARAAILDVGSCMGSFLHAAKPHYAKAMGTEVSAKMRDFVVKKLGVPVFLEQFDRIETAERFSCIHMSHVLEHVPNPSDWMRKAREILAEGGVLVLDVPNMFSLEARWKLLLKRMGLRRGDWKDPSRTPDHLFEPTIPSTLRFLAAQGFEVVEHYTYSRKDPIAWSPWSRLYQRTLRLGSNIRFYARRSAP